MQKYISWYVYIHISNWSIYICLCMYKYMHTCMYEHVHIRVLVRIYVYIYVNIYTVYTHIYNDIYIYIHTHICTYICKFIYLYACIYLCSYSTYKHILSIYTIRYVYIYKHTHKFHRHTCCGDHDNLTYMYKYIRIHSSICSWWM